MSTAVDQDLLNRSSSKVPAFSAAKEYSLSDKVAALRQPPTYPFTVTQIETIETHFAWLFLTEEFVYKLKKPVRIDRLDNSSLDRRQRNCEEELRLNRRLAPHIYLDVVPLTQNPNGGVMLEAAGKPIEWLVKMRRLPAAMLLDHAINIGQVSPDAVQGAAVHLAQFYLSQPHLDVDFFEYDEALTLAVISNKRALLASKLRQRRALIERLIAAQLEFMQRHSSLLAGRAGRLVDGHGDLRPEHIYIGSPPCVIDCVEFDRELRMVDPVEELSLLQLECELLDAGWIANIFYEVYTHISDDRPSAPLRDFYVSHRATVRAKLAAWHLDDPAINNPAHWERKANDYLLAAVNHIELASQ